MSDEQHCPTCHCGRRAPIQGNRAYRDGDGVERRAVAFGTISWAEHLEAMADYGRGQSAERIAERGGFGYWEITKHLGHEPRTYIVDGSRA